MKTKTVYEIKKYELSEEQIIREKLFHVFVFGLPRSGTSMMTHILELLGVKIFHTSEEKKRDYNHLGAEYHPNETGFFEITHDMLEHYLEIMNTPYSGCKMIIPVSNYRLEIVRMIPSKIIMMIRDPEEIRQSQNAFYSQDSNLEHLRSALVHEEVKLERLGLDFMMVDYRDVIDNPQKKVEQVKEFIHSDRDIEEAVRSVNPQAYRFDTDKITQSL